MHQSGVCEGHLVLLPTRLGLALRSPCTLHKPDFESSPCRLCLPFCGRPRVTNALMTQTRVGLAIVKGEVAAPERTSTSGDRRQNAVITYGNVGNERPRAHVTPRCSAESLSMCWSSPPR